MAPLNSCLEQSILIVDDDADFLDCVRCALQANGFKKVVTQQQSDLILSTLASGDYSLLLLDWVMPEPSGASLLSEIVRLYPHLPVVIVTGVSALDNVVSCIRQGAHDYLTKPPDTTRLISVVQKALQSSELLQRNRRLMGYLLGEPLACPDDFSEFITSSQHMLAIFKVIESLAGSNQPVLITGETGVGKELIARAIHRCSGLPGPLVTVNAAGLDDTMLADTLFGHKKGAYTGATESRDGLIEQARGGTLFLDEIGDLSSASQIKLLRLLQQNEYYRLGSDLLRKSDARIISASNGNFQTLLDSGQFRKDLFYRISAHTLHIPSLRERREDILPLAEHFAKKAAEELRRTPPALSSRLCKTLMAYDFPGNVREMINLVRNAVNCNRSGTLQPEDFPGLAPVAAGPGEMVRRIGTNQFSLNRIFCDFPTIDEVESLLVEQAITLAEGNRSAAAKMLGVSRPTLQKKLERLS